MMSRTCVEGEATGDSGTGEGQKHIAEVRLARAFEGSEERGRRTSGCSASHVGSE